MVPEVQVMKMLPPIADRDQVLIYKSVCSRRCGSSIAEIVAVPAGEAPPIPYDVLPRCPYCP